MRTSGNQYFPSLGGGLFAHSRRLAPRHRVVQIADEREKGILAQVTTIAEPLQRESKDTMEQFIQKYDEKVIGSLSGWDRIVFRGTLRTLCYVEGMMRYLSRLGVLLKDFGDHAQAMTQQLITASLAAAKKAGRPVEYLESPKISKEDYAHNIALDDDIQTGLICVLSCVEPCKSYEIHRNRQKKKLELHPKLRKCKFLYHYWIDPEFGFMNARIQTWYPFSIQVCMNGREWLARKMDKARMEYQRYDNSFPWIEDFAKAQRMMSRMLRTAWPRVLDRIARRLNPAHRKMFAVRPVSYYWSGFQTEWATDLAFRSAKDLAAIYPQLVRGAIVAFSCRDVMRFLGKRPDRRFQGQVIGDYRDRPEGVRLKHSVSGNSLKAYDKGGSLLRIETTINNPNLFQAYRASETDPHGPNKWRPMRKGVADMHRRAEVSQQSNGRYLDALASVDTTTPLGKLVQGICRPVHRNGKRYRAMRPWSDEDRQLLETISRGEFATAGFRNRDLASHLYPSCHPTAEQKARVASKVSYRIGILRAHGLIRKVPRQRRYHLTAKGRQISTAILVTQTVTLNQLHRAAA